MRRWCGNEPLLGILACVLVAMLAARGGQACTRAVYLGPENTVITARSMDWPGNMGTNLWVFPRGMARDGAAGPRSLRWTSKYGSLVAAAFEAGTADGMNEKGLVTNMLYLAESQYPRRGPGDTRPPICISVWMQYFLDNFATVAEAVADQEKVPLFVVTVMTPDGKPGKVHVSLSDASGDSAILQYIDGKLVIHHGRQYQVMTNSPAFDQQLAINAYWEEIGGTTMLPGANRSADRFVRASFYIKAIPQTADTREAVAGAFSVIRNVSVPLGITTPEQPNISSTLWRTVADQKHLQYYYEDTRSPNVFWVDLADLDFAPGSPAKRLTLAGGAIFAGNAAAKFEPMKPFAFLETKEQQ